MVKLQGVNLILKCSLNSEASNLEQYSKLVEEMRPKTFDNLELLEMTEFCQAMFKNIGKNFDLMELIRDSLEEELLPVNPQA